jgi:hypothetical protein
MQAPPGPIIVRVVEPSELKGLGDVILGAAGLTGVLVLGALAMGAVLAGIIIGYRKLVARFQTEEQASQTQQLGLTPSGRE